MAPSLECHLVPAYVMFVHMANLRTVGKPQTGISSLHEILPFIVGIIITLEKDRNDHLLIVYHMPETVC